MAEPPGLEAIRRALAEDAAEQVKVEYEKLRFVPNDNREHENAPAFRIFVGQSRVGDAWEARSNGDPPKDYLRVKLDDPSLSEPISAALFPAEDGSSAQLVWNRRRSD